MGTSTDECGGMDAFNAVLESLLSEARANARRDGALDEAREATRAAIESVRGLQRQLSMRQAQDDLLVKINHVLRDAHDVLVSAVSEPDDIQRLLIGRLWKAIEDTNEITF